MIESIGQEVQAMGDGGYWEGSTKSIVLIILIFVKVSEESILRKPRRYIYDLISFD